jgi:hypothetical protein
MSAEFWNGIIADHASAQLRAAELVTPGTYRGWSVSFDYGYWNATHPDFEADWQGEEDGWVGSHPTLSGRTRADMEAEVDAWIEEHSTGGAS